MKKHFTVLVLAIVALAQTGLAPCLAAGLGDELFKLTASDAAANDVFGSSVAISGNTAIVGAPNDNNGIGSAYLFDVTTGQQLRKLTTSDVDEFDFFGASVAISDNKALVGAHGYGSESAYLFDVTTGNELFKLAASDTALGDGFGNSLAISGNTAIIGAAFKQSNAAAGAVYLFDLTTGQELFKLTASDAAVGNSFGTSVAISGNKAIVAAPLGEFDGLASVFDVTTGQELFKLTDSDLAMYDGFAWSVAISGNVALVGNIGDNDVCPGDPICYSGVAWLFDVTTGQRLMKLTAPDAAASDHFGWSVALNDNTALVGATGSNSGTGSAYVFSVVPEPASLALLAFGLPFLIWRPSRRSRTPMAV